MAKGGRGDHPFYYTDPLSRCCWSGLAVGFKEAVGSHSDHFAPCTGSTDPVRDWLHHHSNECLILRANFLAHYALGALIRTRLAERPVLGCRAGTEAYGHCLCYHFSSVGCGAEECGEMMGLDARWAFVRLRSLQAPTPVPSPLGGEEALGAYVSREGRAESHLAGAPPPQPSPTRGEGGADPSALRGTVDPGASPPPRGEGLGVGGTRAKGSAP